MIEFPAMDARFRPVDDIEISRLGFLEDEDILLDDAALCLSAADCPGVDTAPAIEVLAAMEASLRECSIVAETGEEQAGLLSAVIAGEFGFSGDTETYDDLANMDLTQVLERRRGIPVSLAIIFIALARRLRWEAGALDIPGHLLIWIGPDDTRRIVDPFNHGRIVDPVRVRDQAIVPLHANHGDPTAGFRLLSNRDILMRLLLNRAGRLEASGRPELAMSTFRVMTRVAPLKNAARWHLVRLLVDLGDVSSAKSCLTDMLEISRNVDERSQIKSMLSRIGV